MAGNRAEKPFLEVLANLFWERRETVAQSVVPPGDAGEGVAAPGP